MSRFSLKAFAMLIAAVAATGCLRGPDNGGKGDGADTKKQANPAADKGVPIASNKPLDEYTWQDLQDRMANAGLKTSRGMQNGIMWFLPGDGTPLTEANIDGADLSPFSPDDSRGLAVYDHGSSAAAKKEAARIKDVDQKDVLVWGKFIFRGRPSLRENVQSVLERNVLLREWKARAQPEPRKL